MKRVTFGTMLALAFVLVAAIGSRAMAEDVLPDAVKGFSGQVRGVVTAKGKHNRFTFKVAQLLETWKNNKAENSKAVVDLSVRVGPRWAKGDDGRWYPVKLQVAFIRKLEVGQELALEIRNEEANHFNILELSEEQRKWAAVGGEGEGDEGGEGGEGLPKGVRGFSGQVRGVVKAKGDKDAFTFEVARVLEVWKNNKAKDPETLAGLTVQVGPRWVRGEGGKWHPLESHIGFIRQLKVGQELTVEVFNSKAGYFNLLELTAEQREAALEGIAASVSEESRKDKDIKKLQTVIRELRAEMRQLRAENAELRKKLEALEKKKD